jgi:hypothetical protein
MILNQRGINDMNRFFAIAQPILEKWRQDFVFFFTAIEECANMFVMRYIFASQSNRVHINNLRAERWILAPDAVTVRCLSSVRAWRRSQPIRTDENRCGMRESGGPASGCK